MAVAVNLTTYVKREEAVVTLTGELATRVWLRLLEVCHEPV
jgi:hypothetical protein